MEEAPPKLVEEEEEEEQASPISSEAQSKGESLRLPEGQRHAACALTPSLSAAAPSEVASTPAQWGACLAYAYRIA